MTRVIGKMACAVASLAMVHLLFTATAIPERDFDFSEQRARQC